MGFCQVKKNPKIRENSEVGRVGQAPTEIFFLNVFFFSVFCAASVFPNVKKKIG